MPKQFSIIGTGRTKLTDEQFRENLHNDINQFSRSGKTDEKKWAEFVKNIYYQVSDANDFETYKEFGKRIEKHNAEWKTKANVLFYLAVAPNFFPIIASNISKAKLAEDKNGADHHRKTFWSRSGNSQRAERIAERYF
jgi:glucose-6-phosphate 1-dehydrogenase